MEDASKDLVFPRPRQKNPRNDSTSPRDWTVAEVEETMWRVRASGGTDGTPIVFSYRAEDSIRALHVEAFPIEIPRRRPEPEPVAARPAPGPLFGPAAEATLKVVGVLFALPLVLIPLALLWSWAWQLFT